MTSVNPATGAPIRDYPETSSTDLTKLLDKSQDAFESWKGTSFGERAERLYGAAKVLRHGLARYAVLITQEVGKPILQSEAEIEKCALVCEHYADNAEAYLATEDVETDASYSAVFYEPLGVVLAVMPWNFPFWQVFRFAAPAVAAGNVAVLKHASNVPGCSLAIQEVFEKAGFPQGVFTSMLISNDVVADVIANPIVKAVSLTGSEGAGRAIASAAGKHLKKTVMELGGSDPFIVLADADIDSAVRGAAQGRTQNAGQSCIAAKRFIVVESLYEEFKQKCAKAMAALLLGDPMDRATQIGPLARADLVENLHRQVTDSISAGAKLLAGGRKLDRSGFFYEPTVLANVKPGMAAFDEETFGPVAAIVKADDEDHAIALANKSSFGLGASVWTSDVARAESLSQRIVAGSVFINGIVKSDPRLPFGGVKDSGYGRELGRHGILEFVNVKTLWRA